MDAFRTAMSFRFFNWLTNNRIGFCLSQREFRLYLDLKIVQVPLIKNFDFNRTYAKTLYIAHDNFDELHALSCALAEPCVSNRLTIFTQKTNSNSSQITFILIEGYFN
jgi:hypothetical protein